ncbi:uncharacterized protein [Littorina saxatilis]|uniref:uncharacterized protein n=1 Tax=Littorina saxatilis TaxID=31220 RepID=UPI0038B573F1
MPCRGEESVWPAVTCSVRQGVVTLLVLVLMLGPTPGAALCRDRCERVVPRLANLRMLWSRSFKRVGGNRISFEEFMLSLVQASSNHSSRTRGLSAALLSLMNQYQDCMLACEHPFSKRGADRSTHRHTSTSPSSPCNRHSWNRAPSSLLQQLCKTYGP